jgi:hypothetical protein
MELTPLKLIGCIFLAIFLLNALGAFRATFTNRGRHKTAVFIEVIAFVVVALIVFS